LTDQQILTICLSIIVPLSMLLYSNSRITDVKETLRSGTTGAKETLRAEMAALRAENTLGFERITNKIDHLAGEVATLKEMFSTHLREHHNLK
jgi:hypothetical protein